MIEEEGWNWEVGDGCMVFERYKWCSSDDLLGWVYEVRQYCFFFYF